MAAYENLSDDSLIDEVFDIYESMTPEAREELLEAGTNPTPTEEETRDPQTREQSLWLLSGCCVESIKIEEGRRRPKGKKSQDTIKVRLQGFRLQRKQPQKIDELFFIGQLATVYTEATGKPAYWKYGHHEYSDSPFVNFVASVFEWFYDHELLPPPEKWGYYQLSPDEKVDRTAAAANSLVKTWLRKVKEQESPDAMEALLAPVDELTKNKM